jgi:DNA-binding LacI/PurR family transcriptional regulator
VDYSNWLVGVLDLLAGRGLRVPRDVSVACINHDSTFAWHRPRIACLGGDEMQYARIIGRWIDGVARGRVERKHIPCRADFDPGESIGPAPRRPS